MKPAKDELEIVEHWIFDGKRMLSNDQGQRIDWLVRNYLQKLAHDESGWLILYKDIADGRLWELDYPNGEMHGGGPRVLKVISEVEAKMKYKL